MLAALVDRSLGPAATVCVVAVGGYGRGELSPHSDIDLLLLPGGEEAASPESLRDLLYPLWDAGFRVGHAVVSPEQAVARADRDLDAATALLSARRVAGAPDPFDELLDRRARWLRNGGRRLAHRILDATASRHARVERAGWALAPHLRDDVGGLRDLHAIEWLAAVSGTAADADLSGPHGVLMAVRDALHVLEGRKQDRARIDLQPALARALGLEGEDGRDEMMAAVHSAARTVEHLGAAERKAHAQAILGGPRRSGSVQRYSSSITVVEGVLHSDAADAIPGALAVLEAMAATGRPPADDVLAAMRAAFEAAPLERWEPEVLATFLAILASPGAAAALEMLDHLGAWRVLLPEWERVRGLAQHDPYHRYTVDGHSFAAVEAVTDAIAEDRMARAAAGEAGALDVLYLAALLHDIGKGSGEDHSAAGARIAARICRRMGLAGPAAREVEALVRHHLLLVDTASRRDISDPAVVRSVSGSLGDARIARLLYVLSVADGRATGPEGWTPWKASLVQELYLKVLSVLETGIVRPTNSRRMRAADIARVDPGLATRAQELLETLPGSYLDSATPAEMAEELRLLADSPGAGTIRSLIRADERPCLTLVVPDRPGALARSAGVLTLHRLDVLHAQVYSTTDGLAIQRFIAARGPRSWDDLMRDMTAAYSGGLALDARLERKIGDYRPARPPRPVVLTLPDESEHSTVVEVRAGNALGLLYALSSAMAGLDLDIHVAKIDTLGSRVVDVFYVRTAWGTKLTPLQAAELEQAIDHRVRIFFG
jgi:[protein-PII] uridylyltransferase